MVSELVVGIDLGTTHTVCASAEPGPAEPRVFPIPQLVTQTELAPRPLLPSVLYAPLPDEGAPLGEGTWIVGEHARRRAVEAPGRAVTSSKSWLSFSGVDRRAAILPWGARDEDEADLGRGSPRISPVDAARAVLEHVRGAWDARFPAAPLDRQRVVLTVPASFDETARELTVEAARAAGLSVRLLEEPQAAFYDVLRRAPEAVLSLVREREEALVLVVDVGGGTTDLSLFRVKRSGAGPAAERVAVGRHLLLGGDNMDLALAHAAEARLGAGKLGAARFSALALACKAAKETLLGERPPGEVEIAVAAPGSRLVGGTLRTAIPREEAEQLVLGGFFPEVAASARPEGARGGLVAFGLPYERDTAITRHVAHFLARHAPTGERVSGLLLNGGVFRAKAIAERLLRVVASFYGPGAEGPVLLPHPDPDLAVARGAVLHGLALCGYGTRIEGGAARGYYVGIGAEPGGDPPVLAKRAVCVVPRGAAEETRHAAEGRIFAMRVGEPARFELFASDEASHRAGEVVPVDEEAFVALPPIATAVASAERKGPKKGGADVRVRIEGELSAVGTLDLYCVELEGERAHRLAFQLRRDAEAEAQRNEGTGPRHATLPARRLEEAEAAIERAYGEPGSEDPREARGLVRELERILGERAGWTTALARALFDAVTKNPRARRRSSDHERVFWQLAGYCVRPGIGDPRDPSRLRRLYPLFAEKLQFSDEARGWEQFWIAWRRAAAGLEESGQTRIRDAIDPLLAPAEARLKKVKGFKAEAKDALLDLAASLERVPPTRKSELGGWLLEKTWTERDPRIWAALGRLGARLPAYAGVHHVVSPSVAERWLDHLLREKWADLPTAPEAAMRLSRVTGDRARDVSDRVRAEVLRRLAAEGAREALVGPVRALVAPDEAERAAFFGEGLPVGLRLVD